MGRSKSQSKRHIHSGFKIATRGKTRCRDKPAEGKGLEDPRGHKKTLRKSCKVDGSEHLLGSQHKSVKEKGG